MTKIHYIIGEAIATILLILVVIAFVVGKNFEGILSRNFIDFISLMAFALLGSEIFERRRTKDA